LVRHTSKPVFDVEGDHVGVERRAVKLAVEESTAAVDDAAADDTRCLRRIFYHRLPDFLTSERVDRDGLLVVGEVDRSILHQRLRL